MKEAVGMLRNIYRVEDNDDDDNDDDNNDDDGDNDDHDDDENLGTLR